MEQIKAYFDEAGNTGCVLVSNNGILNFKNQPLFALGSVIVQSEADAQALIQKYRDFKKKFSIQGEIKGSDLMTRAKNEHLAYFIENILDDTHFKVNFYDKRFYLATVLLSSLFGLAFKDDNPCAFYDLASRLATQKDEFFEKYCQYITNPNKKDFHDFLMFLKDFDYENIEKKNNSLVAFADCVLSDRQEGLFYNTFLTFGSYKGAKITNVINLNALGELLTFMKQDGAITAPIVLIHDNIDQFQSTMTSELQQVDVSIQFEDSKKSEFLQLADNVTSVMCHAFTRMCRHFQAKEEWQENSRWDMEIYAKLVSEINHKNIKFTVPIADYARSFCVEKLFSSQVDPIYRNSIVFDYLHKTCQRNLMQELLLTKRDSAFFINLLKTIHTHTRGA